MFERSILKINYTQNIEPNNEPETYTVMYWNIEFQHWKKHIITLIDRTCNFSLILFELAANKNYRRFWLEPTQVWLRWILLDDAFSSPLVDLSPSKHKCKQAYNISVNQHLCMWVSWESGCCKYFSLWTSSSYVSCIHFQDNLHHECEKLVATNQFISEKSLNKVVKNKCTNNSIALPEVPPPKNTYFWSIHVPLWDWHIFCDWGWWTDRVVLMEGNWI